SHQALAYYRQLYELERQAKDFSDAQRLQMRQDLSVPILEQFHQWLEAQRPEGLPKSPMGGALGDSLNKWPDDKLYDTIKLIEIPYITTRFELTVQAMRAMVTAPGWLANLKDAELLSRIDRIKSFLRDHHPLNDYELALKLQLANLMPELVSKEERAAA